MSDTWIGTIKLTNEAAVYGEVGAKVLDYIQCTGGILGEEDQPVLWGMLAEDIWRTGEYPQNRVLSVCEAAEVGDGLPAYNYGYTTMPNYEFRFGDTYAIDPAAFTTTHKEAPRIASLSGAIVVAACGKVTRLHTRTPANSKTTISWLGEWFVGNDVKFALRAQQSGDSDVTMSYSVDGGAFTNVQITPTSNYTQGGILELHQNGDTLDLYDLRADVVRVQLEGINIRSVDGIRIDAGVAATSGGGRATVTLETSLLLAHAPIMTAPAGSPNPYKIIGNYTNKVIGDTVNATTDTWQEVRGVDKYALLLNDGTQVNPSKHPQLYAVMKTLPYDVQPEPPNQPFKTIADLT